MEPIYVFLQFQILINWDLTLVRKHPNHRTNILIIRFSSYTYDAQIGQFEPLRLTSRRRIAIHILDPNCAHV